MGTLQNMIFAIRHSFQRLSRPVHVFGLAVLLASLAYTPTPAQAQDVSALTTVRGTVASTSRNTLLIKGQDGRYQLFTFTRNTSKPAALPVGAEVLVSSTPTEDPNLRLALKVTTVTPATTAGAARTEQPPAPPAEPAPAPQPGAAGAGQPAASTAQPDVVPGPLQDTQQAIEREARRIHVGIDGGVALDPELVSIGILARFGPFFSRNLSFRPSFEFAFGEATNLFGLNGEAIYRLPYNIGARRFVYFGGGPGFEWVEQSFSAENKGINFSDFHYRTALNLLLGLKSRNGMFFEMKTSLWASPAPVLRLLVGYEF